MARRASPRTHDGASHAGSALVVIEPELVFSRFQSCPRSPIDGLRPRPAFQMAVPAGHQVVKKARSSSAMRRRISRPRVHKPSICTVELLSLKIGQFEITPIVAAAVLWFRLRPTGASSRMSAASGDVCSRTGDRRSLAPGSEHMALLTQHVALPARRSCCSMLPTP